MRHQTRAVGHELRLISLAILVLAPASSDAQQFATAAATTAAVAPTPIDPHVMFAGAPFVFAGGDRERRALAAAIDRSIADMFFAIRPIARSRVASLNPVYPTVTIRFVNGQIEMVLPGSPFFRSPETGARIAWTAENGNPAQLSQRFENGGIVQEIVAPNGMRRNEYSLSPDGHTLTMRVRITARQLPAPLTYVLTYRR